jgi:hypothetical protein
MQPKEERSATVVAFMQKPRVHELCSTEYSSDCEKTSVSPAADVLRTVAAGQADAWMDVTYLVCSKVPLSPQRGVRSENDSDSWAVLVWRSPTLAKRVPNAFNNGSGDSCGQPSSS